MTAPVTVHLPSPPALSLKVLAGVGKTLSVTFFGADPFHVTLIVHTPGESVQVAALKQSSNAREKMKLQNE